MRIHISTGSHPRRRTAVSSRAVGFGPLAVVALLLTSVLGSVAAASSTGPGARRVASPPRIDYGWSPSMTWGFGVHPLSAVNGNRCHAGTKVWVRENGVSGVTQLKAKFELRAHYDSGFYGTSYQTRGWFYSKSFPNDVTSYYQYFVAQFYFPIGGQYKIRGVLVGVRPGFWRIDRQAGINLGPVGCEQDAGGGVDSGGDATSLGLAPAGVIDAQRGSHAH